MKKLAFLLLFAPFICFGQNDDLYADKKAKQTSGDIAYEMNTKEFFNPKWKIGTDRYIYKGTMKRLEGDYTAYRATNIYYESKEVLVKKAEADAKKKMWSEEKLKNTIDEYDLTAAGGMVFLYVSRHSLETARSEHFSIIIQDTNGKELYRKHGVSTGLPDHSSIFWYSFIAFPIAEEVPSTFKVFIIDDLTEPNKYEFLISLKSN